jgi:hypothetical protein
MVVEDLALDGADEGRVADLRGDPEILGRRLAQRPARRLAVPEVDLESRDGDPLRDVDEPAEVVGRAGADAGDPLRLGLDDAVALVDEVDDRVDRDRVPARRRGDGFESTRP